MNVLSVKHVWKKTETAFLLKDVSLFINDGEWLLISGPVGDGKESLQKVLLGFDDDYEGCISLHNKDIKSMKDYPAKIALIHNHLIDENNSKTIYEYLAFPLRLEGINEKEVEKTINHLLRQFSFSFEFEKDIHDLSLEEKITIAFLRATILRPSLIFIDEPFYQLSNSKRKLILTTIKDKLREWKGCPVVIFSSYIYEWLPYCDRLVVMKNKTILQAGDPRVLLENPNHVFVAKYMNEDGFSFLKGVVKGQQFLSPGYTFRIPQKLCHEYQLFNGQELLIGIPAGSFQIVENSSQINHGLVISVPIQILKQEKNNLKIYTNVGSQPLVAQIKKSGKISEGDQIQLYTPFEELYFFDAVTEKRLIQRG